MPTLTLADINWVPALLVVAFLFVAVLMILIVLIQRPQGGGLSGAFGASAAGSGQTAFGARTGDALTIATILIFCVFLLVSIGLNFALRPTRGAAMPTVGEPGAPAALTEEAQPAAPADGPMRIEVAPPSAAPTPEPAPSDDAEPDNQP